MKKVGKYYTGQYKVINVEKYEGNYNNVVYRSSWEKRFFNWCDLNINIVKWNSEELVIPYICPTDNKQHRYFVDAKISVKQKNGQIRVFIVEIKPLSQTIPPKYPGRKTKRYLIECAIFAKNTAKWAYATQYANDRKWEFKIITQYDLGIS